MPTFEENKHPRNEQGKFVEKGQEQTKEYRQNTTYEKILDNKSETEMKAKKGVKQARTEFAQVVDGWRPYGYYPVNGKYFIADARTEEIDNLLRTIYNNGGDYTLLQGLIVQSNGGNVEELRDAREIAKMSYDEIVDYLSVCKSVQEREKKEQENKINQSQIEHQTIERQKDDYINNVISSLGIDNKHFGKLKEALNYREQKSKELSTLANQVNYSQSGYVDGKKSVRAVKAELNKKYPASECAKMLGTTTKKIKDNLTPTEWHHSGGDMYNKINYYDISKLIDLQEDIDLANDSDYKESVEVMKKLF